VASVVDSFRRADPVRLASSITTRRPIYSSLIQPKRWTSAGVVKSVRRLIALGLALAVDYPPG